MRPVLAGDTMLGRGVAETLESADPARGHRGRRPPAPVVLTPHPAAAGAVGLLERLGERWYRLAARTARRPLTGTLAVVADVAERFSLARRTLNYLTDRHLFGHRVR